MRNPNGINVRKLPNAQHRRNPFQARKLIGYNANIETGKASPVYRTIGYFPTRKKAIEAAMDYGKNPFAIEYADMTFKEIYDAFSKAKFADLSKSSIYNYTSSVKHFESLYNVKFRLIRAMDYEALIEHIPRTTRMTCKILLDNMYKYAEKNDIVQKNVADVLDWKIDRSTKLERNVFSSEEIKKVWEDYGSGIGSHCPAIILIGLYTGFRPGEVVILRTDDVHIEEGYIQGGIKNESSRNRKVPIHDSINDLIKSLYESAVNTGSEFLFVNTEGRKLTMNRYGTHFREYMARTGMNHMPHDTRHTFITAAEHCGMDKIILKKIVGHTVNDITAGTYTHYIIDDLKKEIDKIIY